MSVTIYRWDKPSRQYKQFGSVPNIYNGGLRISDDGRLCIALTYPDPLTNPDPDSDPVVKVIVYVHTGGKYVPVPANFPPSTIGVELLPDGGLLVTTMERSPDPYNPLLYKTLYYKQV